MYNMIIMLSVKTRIKIYLLRQFTGKALTKLKMRKNIAA